MRVRVVLNRIFGADEEDEEGEGEGEGVEEEEDWRRRKKKSVENDCECNGAITGSTRPIWLTDIHTNRVPPHPSAVISITAHAGTINAFTTVLGRDRANLATGSRTLHRCWMLLLSLSDILVILVILLGLLPIVVKATRKQISNCKRR